MTRIPRRTVVPCIAATAICSPAVVRPHRAVAALPLLPNLPASDALLLRPGDAQFAQYEPAFNARTMLTPQLRAMCKTPNAVGVMIDWCRSNNMPFAVCCGGTSALVSQPSEARRLPAPAGFLAHGNIRRGVLLHHLGCHGGAYGGGLRPRARHRRRRSRHPRRCAMAEPRARRPSQRRRGGLTRNPGALVGRFNQFET